MKNSSTLKPMKQEPSRRRHSEASLQVKLRPRDFEALCRLRDNGPLTIPQAYDCGHSNNETTGHGMNRLVAASLVAFCGWNKEDEDALWMITPRGNGRSQCATTSSGS